MLEYNVERHFNQLYELLIDNMPLEKVSVEEARAIAERAGLKPGKVVGTEIIRFIKVPKENLEEISWDDFGRILRENNLAIYRWKDWLKIMKER